MRIEYDQKYNVAYIRFLGGPAKDLQTLHVSEELNIDMTPDGHIYGIELSERQRAAFPARCGEAGC